jgi:chemotaxis protein MotA
MIAADMGRRAVPGHVRPTFQEMEKTCRNRAAAPAEAAA